MTDLVQKFGSKLEQNKDGVFPDLNAARLKKIFPELFAFAEKAQPGDVSHPIPLKGEAGQDHGTRSSASSRKCPR